MFSWGLTYPLLFTATQHIFWWYRWVSVKKLSENKPYKSTLQKYLWTLKCSLYLDQEYMLCLKWLLWGVLKNLMLSNLSKCIKMKSRHYYNNSHHLESEFTREWSQKNHPIKPQDPAVFITVLINAKFKISFDSYCGLSKLTESIKKYIFLHASLTKFLSSSFTL